MELLPIGFVKAIQNEKGPDGLVYEDSYVIITRKDNRLIQTGKPLRSVFIYAKPL